MFDPLHFTGLEPSWAALSNVNPNSYVVAGLIRLPYSATL